MNGTAGTAQATESTAPLNTDSDAAAAFADFLDISEAPAPATKRKEPKAALEGGDEDEDDLSIDEDGDEELPPADEDDDEEQDPKAKKQKPDEDPEDPEVDEDEAELIPVKIDGKTERLTLDELKKGYSRTKVFTQKTMEAAEIRKQAEAVTTTLQEERTYLAALAQQLTEKLAAAEQEPDWATLRETDPVEWAIQKQVWADKAAERGRLRKLNDELLARNAANQEASQAKLLEDERGKLFDKVPAWKKDGAAAAKELAAIGRFMVDELGFTEAEAGQVYDHRAVLALRDAMRFRSLIARQAAREAKGGAPLASTAAKGPKALVPGRSRERPGRAQVRTEAINRLKQTGLESDAVRAFMTIPGLL